MMIQETSQNGTTILEGSGRLDFNTRKEIQNAVKSAIASGSRSIVFSLKDVSYIDSAGLGILLLASKGCNQSNVSFSLCAIEGYVNNVLDIGNIKQQIPIFDSLGQALSHRPRLTSP